VRVNLRPVAGGGASVVGGGVTITVIFPGRVLVLDVVCTGGAGDVADEGELGAEAGSTSLSLGVTTGGASVTTVVGAAVLAGAATASTSSTRLVVGVPMSTREIAVTTSPSATAPIAP
jgi:hypothetical protein